MEKMRTILKKLMDRAGHNPYYIERETGLPAATTYRFLKGDIDQPKVASIRAWASVYGVTEGQLRGDVPIPEIDVPAEKPELKDLLPLDEYKHVALVKRMDKETRAILYSLAERLAANTQDRRREERRKDEISPNNQFRFGEKYQRTTKRQIRAKDFADGRHVNPSRQSQIA